MEALLSLDRAHPLVCKPWTYETLGYQTSPYQEDITVLMCITGSSQPAVKTSGPFQGLFITPEVWTLVGKRQR